jgi:hypothetical protein
MVANRTAGINRRTRERNFPVRRSQAEVVRCKRQWELAVRFGILDFHSMLLIVG